MGVACPLLPCPCIGHATAMTFQVDMGTDGAGKSVPIDLEELLATRLLVQGNSGSGKSHLLRRLLERSANQVQQIIIDPEGDFTTLAGPYGHTAIEAVAYSVTEVTRFAARCREHRASVVLSLEGLEMEGQMRCAAAFLMGLFDAPREFWYPALVVVDEAQIFAPAAGAEVSEEIRRASLSAMTNLMCRGRKRGLAGIIATQRLAKLSKNVAAEASNFLMGRTFLDIDMARAADLLGMERRQAEAIRDLQRGTFLALGPAVSRRPVEIRIGAVETSARSGSPILTPLPDAPAADMKQFLLEGLEDMPPPPPPPAAPRTGRGADRADLASGRGRAGGAEAGRGSGVHRTGHSRRDARDRRRPGCGVAHRGGAVPGFPGALPDGRGIPRAARHLGLCAPPCRRARRDFRRPGRRMGRSDPRSL